jgi:hypothetical protein
VTSTNLLHSSNIHVMICCQNWTVACEDALFFRSF